MSKLILPTPVVLAMQTFDCDTSGATIAGTTLTADGIISPVSFYLPPFSVVKNAALEFEILATASQIASGTFKIQVQLAFTDMDGTSNAATVVLPATASAMSVNAATNAQIIGITGTLVFAQGVGGAPTELRPIATVDMWSSNVDGTSTATLNTGSWGTAQTPAMVRTNLDRRCTIQINRTSTGVGASRLNIRAVKVVGIGLNMNNQA